MSDKDTLGNPWMPESWRRSNDRAHGGHRKSIDEGTGRRQTCGQEHHDHHAVTAYPHHAETVHQSRERDGLSALRTSRAGARRIGATDGTQWFVYEFRHPNDRDHPSLVFESDDVVRRLRVYPAEWRELSDEMLAELSQNR